MEPRRFWTAQELNRVKALYPSHPTSEVAAELGRSILSVYQAAAKAGLHKTAECRAKAGFQKGSQIGAEHRFKRSSTPANKGLRRPGWSVGRMRETQFKKGARSGAAERNWRPVGTVLTDPEGYLRIKVREAVHGKEPYGFGNSHVWQQLNRHVWEQVHGPVPAGHVVAFKDRNKANCAIENLECISRGELARRNRMWVSLPRELCEAIQANGVLKRKLRKMQNGKE